MFDDKLRHAGRRSPVRQERVAAGGEECVQIVLHARGPRWCRRTRRRGEAARREKARRCQRRLRDDARLRSLGARTREAATRAHGEDGRASRRVARLRTRATTTSAAGARSPGSSPPSLRPAARRHSAEERLSAGATLSIVHPMRVPFASLRAAPVRAWPGQPRQPRLLVSMSAGPSAARDGTRLVKQHHLRRTAARAGAAAAAAR